MKTIAFMPLHYGREYLYAAISAIEPFVEQVLILYTPRPSYGHVGDIPNPEKREELLQIATDAAKGKLIWNDIQPTSREGDHRNQAINYLKLYDLIFSVDADEVWHPDYVEQALTDAYNNPCSRVGLGGDCWYHLWRSFNECHRDGFYPIRFQKKHGKDFNAAEGIIHSGRIYHMSYAQSELITRYKISCQGHKDEIADSWIDDKWLNYTRGVTKNMHPSSNQIWIEAQLFDKNTLPDVLKTHINFNKERIE